MIIFITPSIYSFEIISLTVPEPKIFSCIPASAVDDAALNHSCNKTP